MSIMKNSRWTLVLDNGDCLDLHPEYLPWESLSEYYKFLEFLWGSDPMKWITVQTVGPEVSFPVSRIHSINRIH